MSKQQDELLTRVDQLLLDVVMPVIEANIIGVDTTLAAAEGTRKVAAFINSEVQAALDKVDEENRTYYQVTQFNRASLQRDKVSRTIEEVRKDYE